MSAPAFNPLESYRVEEKTSTAFVQADMAGERWFADVGVRFVRGFLSEAESRRTGKRESMMDSFHNERT